MVDAKVIGRVEVSIGNVKIIGIDGVSRTTAYEALMYEGEQLVSQDPATLFQIKYLALREATAYEGIFAVLSDGSLIVNADEIVSIFGDDDAQNLETASGEERVEGSSGFAEEAGIFADSSVQGFYRGENGENGLGITDSGINQNANQQGADQTPPVIASSNVVVFDENSTDPVIQVLADDESTLSFSLKEGLDSDLFSIDPGSGVLIFKNAPDYETPLDIGSDNEYNVEVIVTDAIGNYTTQFISINVNNVNEAPVAVDDIAGGDAVVQGEIEDLNEGMVSVDHVTFDYTGSGSLAIDMLSERGSGGSYVDIDGDGVQTNLDTQIHLFRWDAGSESWLYVASDDDGGLGDDGSTHGWDSYMSFGDGELGAGQYMLAVSDYHFSLGEALDDSQDASSYGVNPGDYQITFTGNVVVTNVPENATVVSGAGSIIYENDTVAIDVLYNDTDVDAGATFTLDSLEDGHNPAFSIVDNKLAFTPDEAFDYLAVGETTEISVVYTMSDEFGLESSATATLLITGTNDAPVAVLDGSTAIVVNATATSGALMYDSGADGNAELLGGATSIELSVTISTDSNNSNSILSYASSENNNDFLIFTNDTGTSIGIYIDGASHYVSVGGTIYDGTPHEISVSWDSVIGTTVVSVDGVQKGSFILAQGHTIGENGVLMLGQEQDSVGGGLDANQIFSGEYHDLTISTNGTEIAHWEMETIDNGIVADSLGNFDLSVVANVNVVQHDSLLTTTEDTPLEIDVNTLLSNDTDIDGDTLNIVSVQDAVDGTVSLNIATGKIIFTPDVNHNGEASFTYSISDSNGGVDTTSVFLNVTPINDAPIALDDTYVGNFDTIAVNTTTTDGRMEFDSRGDNAELLGGATALNVSMIISSTMDATQAGLLSYATTGSHNEFLIFTSNNGKSVGIYINGEAKYTTVNDLFDGSEHTLNVSWDSTDGTTTISVDGVVKGSFTGHATGHSIGENGVMMLGQEQDSVGGGLASNQIFEGEYHDLSVSVNGSEVAHYEMNSLENGTVVDSVGSFNLSTTGDVSVVAHRSPLVTDEDEPLTIDVNTLLTNDYDVDGDALTITNLAMDEAYGTIGFDVNGDIVYTPKADFNGEALFTYTVNDGNGETDTATVTMNVLAVNDAPVAVDDEDLDGYLDVTPEHAHINLGDEAAFDFTTAFTISQNVTFEGNGGIIFNKENSYEVAVYSDGSVKYALNEASGSNTWAWNDTGYNLPQGEEHHISFVYDGSANTVTLFVDGISEFSGNANVPSSLANTNADLRFGERGANNQPFEGQIDDIQIHDVALDATSIGLIAGGELVTSNLVASYDFNGDTPLEDTSGNNHTATLVSGAEILDILDTREDTSITIKVSDLLANDSDVENDALSITAVTNGAHGAAVLSLDGETILYTPDDNYFGEDSFTYTLSDGGLTDIATVTFNILSVNDVPVIEIVGNVTSYEVDEDRTLSINSEIVITDEEDGTITLTQDMLSASHGSVTLDNGTIKYEANDNYNGQDTIKITVTDSDGGVSVKNISVTVNPVNDVPVAQDDSEDNFVAKGGYLDVTPEHAHINLGDEADFDFTTAFTISQNVTFEGNGGIIFNKENSYEVAVYSDGSVKYALNEASGSNTWVWNDTGYNLAQGEEHHISFVYDGSANTVTLFVDGVAEFSGNTNVPSSLANTGSDLRFGERGSNGQPFEGQIDDIQIHSVALDATAIGLIAGGQLVTSDLVASYDFNGETPLEDTSGNGHTATLVSGATIITTTTANETPYTTDEDESLTIDVNTLLANDYDVDGDALTITNLTMDEAYGTVEMVNGDIVYTPKTDFNGEASFTYTVNDGTVDSLPATVTMNVLAVNDAPVANIDQFEDGADAGTLVTHLYDKNGTDVLEGIIDALYTTKDHYYFDHHSMGYTGYNYMGSSQDGGKNDSENNNWFADHGINRADLRGGIIEFADGSQGRIDTASDGSGNTESAYIYYKVYDGLDADPMTVDENGNTISIDVLANDTDVDSSSLTINDSLVNETGKGLATTDGNTISFNPGNDFNHLAPRETEEVIVKYTITDGNLVSDESEVVIVVTGSDDLPTVTYTDVADVTIVSGAVYSNDFIGQIFDKTDADAQVQTSVTTNQTDSGGSYTMSAWVKPQSGVDSGAKNGREVIFSSDSQNGGYDWGISIDSDQFAIYTGEGYHNFATVNYDNWQQVTAVFDNDSNTYQMYVNGTEVDNGNFTNGSFDTNTSDIMIGENPSTNWAEHFSGEMGEVQIYEQALTSQEIVHNYDTQADTYGLIIEEVLVVNDIDAGSIDLVTLLELATQEKSLDKIELSGKTELDINIADVIEVTDADNELLIISTDDVNDTVHLDDSFKDASGNFVNMVDNSDDTHTYGDVANTVLITIEDTITVD